MTLLPQCFVSLLINPAVAILCALDNENRFPVVKGRLHLSYDLIVHLLYIEIIFLLGSGARRHRRSWKCKTSTPCLELSQSFGDHKSSIVTVREVGDWAAELKVTLKLN